MKKKVLSVMLISAIAATMVGCGDDITLDKRQNELIAEYVAGEMLKFSYDNEWNYTKVRTALNKYESNGTSYYTTQATTASSTTTATTKANSTTATASSSGTTGTTTAAGGTTTATTAASTDVYKTLADTLGITNAAISLKGGSATERYPMEEYAVCISAKDGYKIVAVEFEIKNNSSSAITLNTSSSGVTMRLEIGGKTIVQTASMLANDIISLDNVTVAAGSSYTAAACFQVPETIAVGEATVNIFKSGNSIGTISGIKLD
jgi:hypothetical protein